MKTEAFFAGFAAGVVSYGALVPAGTVPNMYDGLFLIEAAGIVGGLISMGGAVAVRWLYLKRPAFDGNEASVVPDLGDGRSLDHDGLGDSVRQDALACPVPRDIAVAESL